MQTRHSTLLATAHSLQTQCNPKIVSLMFLPFSLSDFFSFSPTVFLGLKCLTNLLFLAPHSTTDRGSSRKVKKKLSRSRFAEQKKRSKKKPKSIKAARSKDCEISAQRSVSLLPVKLLTTGLLRRRPSLLLMTESTRRTVTS